MNGYWSMSHHVESILGVAARHAPACPQGRAAASAGLLPTGLARHWRAGKAGDGAGGAERHGKTRCEDTEGALALKVAFYFLYSTACTLLCLAAPLVTHHFNPQLSRDAHALAF